MAKGEYDPWPVDIPILELLPEVGTIGGVHWRGRRARDVRDELNQDGQLGAEVKTGLISARLREMHKHDLARSFPGGGNGGFRIWARTDAGTRIIRNKEAQVG